MYLLTSVYKSGTTKVKNLVVFEPGQMFIRRPARYQFCDRGSHDKIENVKPYHAAMAPDPRNNKL